MVAIPERKHSIVDSIYALYEQGAREAPRPYLGASIIGGDCERALWYGFRWACPSEEISGRKLRLFETGHREEARIIAELKAVGVEVAGEQTGVSAVGGHFRGHMDGVVLGLPESPKTPHVLEIKTHNEKSYADLWKKGVQKSKPVHYAQMQIYMHFSECKRALYLSVNKNDDTLYSERIAYDGKFAFSLMKKAWRIIEAHKAPSKLHEDPEAREAFVCGWCPAKAVCHEGEFAQRNCRTCLSSTPLIDDTGHGAWRCDYWDTGLTIDQQRLGCPMHRYLPSFVPGEQTDAVQVAVPNARNRNRIAVTYKMKDGKEWCDGFSAT